MTAPATTGGDLVDAYLAAWNAHDGAAVAAAFAPGGTYEDPMTGAIGAAALPGAVDRLCAAFPDLAVERTAHLAAGARHVVEWVLRGEHRGPLHPGVAPTGGRVALRGVDVLEVGADGIRAARRHFDQVAIAEQLGLMALIQPVEQGPARFGYSMRVPSGPSRPPGIIALTWIQGADEGERDRIRAHARANVQDFTAEPGFISIVTGFTGLRGFTVTAWEDEASMTRALSGHHAVAMQELFSQDFVASVWTSVWRPVRLNRLWVRCPACRALEDATDDHRTCTRCDAPLPERPAYW